MNTPKPISFPDVIPDLLDEQTSTDIQRSKERILERAAQFLIKTPADCVFAEIIHASINGQKMADEIRDYLEVVAGNLGQHQSERSCAYVNRLADYARQLETQALLELEMLTA